MTPMVALVVDSITLAPTVTVSASEARIGSPPLSLVALRRTPSRYVQVSGSTVELTGKVQSWAEYRQALNAAWATPGVRFVRNLIRVAS